MFSASTLYSTTETIYKQSSLEKKVIPYEISPQSLTTNYSEGKVPLLNTTEKETELATVQLFVKTPLEDRSKYEKLTQYAFISSEDSAHDDIEPVKATDKIKRKRKIKHIPEKIQSVYKNVELPIVKSLKEKSTKNAGKKSKKKHSNEQTDAVEIDSDDSIGSASDLRVDEDAETNISKPDAISETISESIRTCGSSAYHAECESMATHEEDAISRIIRNKLKEETKSKGIHSEDMLFVGHQYGEKPLLLDDELDSDSEIKYDNYKWSIERKNIDTDLWVKKESSTEDPTDVFALAPFNTTKIKSRTECSPHPKCPNKLETYNSGTPIVSRETSPIFTSTPFKVSETEQFVTDNVKVKHNDLFSSQNLCLNPFLNNDFDTQAAQNTSIYGVINNLTILTPNIPVATNDNNYLKKDIAFDRCSNIGRDDYFINDKETVIYENEEISFGKFENDFSRDESFYSQTVSETDRSFFTMQSGGTFQKNNSLSNTQDILNEQNDVEDAYSKEDVPSLKYKKDRKKESKSKYFLIDDRVSDENAATVQKIGKPKGYAHKKTSKVKKINRKGKSQAGFSNMSFEDFPSDEGEVNENIVRPFEVLRNADEKKYGSLKRKGNPFS